jgi:drug/metabolite transporter (DMT)-like permease
MKIRSIRLPAALGNHGVQAALMSAVLFGAGTPFAKFLLGNVSPWMLAGLLYCGSGLGLSVIRLVRRAPRVHLNRSEILPLIGSIVFGGILGPVLLLVGLSNMPASGASLLLNAEGVFTALLAWFVFRENFDRRIALGMLAVVAGAIVITVPQGIQFGDPWPALAVLGACASWGLDNNITRKIASTDATWLAAVKGAVAGPVNLIFAFALGAQLPPIWNIAGALIMGFFAYGISLTLFIVGMRHVGTARAGAYYSVAPFIGAIIAIAVGEPLTWPLLLAGLLMGIGIWLHLTERHAHEHSHPAITHNHLHTHDENHQHDHLESDPLGTRHRHEHHHDVLIHSHEHYPDTQHRHDH